MKLYMAAVPLFDSNMSVDAYNFHAQDSEKLFGLSDNHTALNGAMSSPILDILNTVGIEPFTGGKPVCVPINRYQLLSDCVHNCSIPPELLILIISKDLPLEDMYIHKCHELKEAGYKLAIAGIKISIHSSKLYRIADYVLMDTSNTDCLDKVKAIRLEYPYIKIIFTKVADIKSFDSMKIIGNSLFEGSFYNQPITKINHKVSPLKTNALNLLKLVGDEDFELDEVSRIIQQDTSLSIQLLKFINSPAIGISNKVTSIKSAVALLGQKETRKWIMAFVSMAMADDKPNEITKLSLTRAKFAENLATSFEMGIHAPTLFLMGLFSLLDVILEMPMQDAINEISVSEKVKEALVDCKGDFYDVIQLIYAYERADWNSVSYISILKKIEPSKLNQAFYDSLVWYRDLLSEL